MGTVTKKDLIELVAEQTKQTRSDVKRTIQGFLDRMKEELCHGNRLEFRDFGVFEVRERAARTAQNPKTLQQVRVPPKKTVKFKIGRLLREGLDNGKASPKVTVEVKPRSRGGAAVR